MKRRLRKKKRLGEFRELGFSIQAQLSSSSKEARLAFIERFVDAVERRALLFGGGCSLDGLLEGFVMPRARGSATVEDLEAVLELLQSAPEVTSFEVGQLKDAWHGLGTRAAKGLGTSAAVAP
ncbi:MAG: hypothetical protein B6A08_02415 [Sorangiineae bacterium NIC37A_2]|jgi:uncharacterized protein YggL (DUF469 family)|nr:MAG: hypothetical protein B6A08_02415 [Sorangiineae bacterium NIC37A_2]